MDYKDYLAAGKATATVRDYGATLIKKGESLLSVTQKIEEKVRQLKVECAFPPQISCDNIAAHYCPEPDDKVIFENQVASLDVGLHVNGCIGDTAITVDLSGKHADMIKAAQEALQAAEKTLQIGTTLSEIGAAIQQTIESYGFKPVKNLSGHGVSPFNIHNYPSIPNYDNGDEAKLEKGMVIAIEPFATNGVGLVREKNEASVFNMVGKKSFRIGFVRDIQKELEKFNGLPFTSRWLMPKFSESQIRYALNQFNEANILSAHPLLVEQPGNIVTQAEHTYIIDDKVV